MKTFIKPLIVSAIIIASTTIYAESYTDDSIKEIVGSQDKNSDKKITFDEYSTAIKKDNYDTNQDGYITKGEISEEMTNDLEDTINQLRNHQVPEEDANKTINSELNSIDNESEALLKRMDCDGDNLIEPEEIAAYQRKEFDAFDKNKDGVISKADITKQKPTGDASTGFGFRYDSDI